MIRLLVVFTDILTVAHRRHKCRRAKHLRHDRTPHYVFAEHGLDGSRVRRCSNCWDTL